MVPIWLTSNCSNACLCNDSGITIYLPFWITPSITAMSLKTSSMFSWLMVFNLCHLGNHGWYVSLRFCRCSSCDIACCSLCIPMHSSMSVVVCMVSIFNYMPGILCLCFPCGFVWKASLLWTNLVQACI